MLHSGHTVMQTQVSDFGSGYRSCAREDCGDCGGGSSKRGWRGFAGESTGVERVGRARGMRGSTSMRPNRILSYYCIKDNIFN
jgi:hypothetical protein